MPQQKKLQSKTPVIYVEYTDDGCCLYRCGKCRIETESRSDPGKFCRNCGIRFSGLVEFEKVVKNRWKRAIIDKLGPDRSYYSRMLLLGDEDILAYRKPGWLSISEPMWVVWIEIEKTPGEWERLQRSSLSHVVVEDELQESEMDWSGSFPDIAGGRRILNVLQKALSSPTRLAIRASTLYRPAYRDHRFIEVASGGNFQLDLVILTPDGPLELRKKDDRTVPVSPCSVDPVVTLTDA